jgi:ADP-ribose pyrophosphatase YjhB (NUDIX family)
MRDGEAHGATGSRGAAPPLTGRIKGASTETQPARSAVEACFMAPLTTLIRSKIAHLTFLATRPMTLGVRGVVVGDRDTVLLVRHGYVSGWHFPGGGVEVGESCFDALERELAEEACVAVRGEPALHGLFFNERSSRRDHVAVYVIRDFAVLGERKPDREIAEARFFHRSGLPDGTTSGTRARLAEIFDFAPLATRW